MLPTAYQKFIHLSRYSRWRDADNRRETWEETIKRWIDFWAKQLITKHGFTEDEAFALLAPIGQAIIDLDTMPSMRGLMTAGPALEKDHAAGYNCAYMAMDDQVAFAELLYLAACGTGDGFSVERQVITRLPRLPESIHPSSTTIVVEDSKVGWAAALRQLVAMLFVGQVPGWDVSQVRPRGARLKTFGGRASGPEPLVDLFKFTVAMFKNAVADGQARLTSIQVHDLICNVGDCIVSGGVRRTALISLSNLSDDRMRDAKTGDWRRHAKWRELANNSAAYTERPDFRVFMNEMVSLYESYSGERGIFSRVAAQKKAAENGRRQVEYTDEDGKTKQHEYGTNPCGEIILRSMQFCNLSEVVLRPADTFEDVKRKVELATQIGTLQSTLTDFRFLRKAWKDNCDQERLLGVSLTGILDHPVLGDPKLAVEWLPQLREHAVAVNATLAARLGIPVSAAITTVKPSGTVSQLVDSSSGIHPRWSPYYIRRVKNSDTDPITQFLKSVGVPHEAVKGKEGLETVFAFPMKSPETARLRQNIKALDQLELYRVYHDHWCEHNPSTTIYYKDDDFFAVSQWIWENFDQIGGVSFLPGDDHVYPQAPYEEISKEEYEKLVAEMPAIDWSRLIDFEDEDHTQPNAEPACAGGVCEIS